MRAAGEYELRDTRVRLPSRIATRSPAVDALGRAEPAGERGQLAIIEGGPVEAAALVVGQPRAEVDGARGPMRAGQAPTLFAGDGVEPAVRKGV